MKSPNTSAPSVPSSWAPLGHALLDYEAGDHQAALEVIMEDGNRLPLPAAAFFDPPNELPDVELVAFEFCLGRVLDVGAGAGRHTLELQNRGHEVVALDVCPEAVAVMARRGVEDPRRGDVFQHQDPQPYDTLLLLMNGLGLVGDLAGLDIFLAYAHTLLAPGGQIIVDSSDLRSIDDVDELARAAERQRCGRYRSETRQQLEYGGLKGRPFGWLYTDQDLLTIHAKRQGWHPQVVFEDEEGTFLCRLVAGSGF
jgi:SAM-dependent methyltransferase